MKLWISLLVFVASSSYGMDLSKCSDGGDMARWLLVEVGSDDDEKTSSFPLSSSHSGGQPTGANFCLGRTKNGRFLIRQYADPQCAMQTETLIVNSEEMTSRRHYKRGFLPRREEKCGKFDYNAASCANSATRRLAYDVADQSTTAEQFVSKFVAEANLAVGAVTYRNEYTAFVRQVVYTDQHICSMAVKLENGENLVFLASNLSPIETAHSELNSQLNFQLPAAQFKNSESKGEKDLPASVLDRHTILSAFKNDTEANKCETNAGHWSRISFVGLNRSTIAGQFDLGNNFCVDSDKHNNRLDLMIRQNLHCGGEARITAGMKASSKTTTHARDMANPSGHCKFDPTHGQCIDESIKRRIVDTLSSSHDIVQITDHVFTSLSQYEQDSGKWVVFAAEMRQPFSISCTLRTDPNHCFVISEAHGKTFALFAAVSD